MIFSLYNKLIFYITLPEIYSVYHVANTTMSCQKRIPFISTLNMFHMFRIGWKLFCLALKVNKLSFFAYLNAFQLSLLCFALFV